MGETVAAGQIETYYERRGEGPEVLLIAGLGDPAEAWEAQLDGLSDRYTLTAFDNRGAGRVPLTDDPLTVETFADDAAALMRALDVPAAHVCGFSGGGVIAQHLALRHPEMVRSLVLNGTFAALDPYMRAALNFWRWLPDAAPSERAFFDAFFLWIYTPRAHADGTVDKIIEETLRRTRHDGPPGRDRGADAGHHRRDRPGLPTARGTRARRGNPRRAVRADGGRGAPAVPGSAGALQRDGRRLLARGGRAGSSLRFPSDISEGCRSG